MGRYHLPDAVLALTFKVRIAHIFFRQSSGMVFLPHQNPLFVAQIQKDLIIGIMRGADRIRPKILRGHKVILNRRVRKGAAELRMILVAAEALDKQLSSVQEKISSQNPDLPETHTVNEIVLLFPASVLQHRFQLIQLRRFRRPGSHPRTGERSCAEAFCLPRPQIRRQNRPLFFPQVQLQRPPEGLFGQTAKADFCLALPVLAGLLSLGRKMNPFQTAPSSSRTTGLEIPP